VKSAGDDPLQAVTEQAAVLDAAPSLAAGTLALDGEALGKGVFVWIEVEQDGLYQLSLSNPGALVLGSFPTADGRYDGKTKPALHRNAKSQTLVPTLRPLLLSPAHPYLLSASSSAGAGTLELTLLEAAPALSGFPEDNAVVPAGDSLYAATGRANMMLPGTTETHRIEVIGEVRSTNRAYVLGKAIPAGGIYPWMTSTDSILWFEASAGKDSSPPRVLVRFTPDATDLDETEPNFDSPNTLGLGVGFSGHLLTGDHDRLAFDLPADMQLALSIAMENSGRFSVKLLRKSDDKETLLLQRKSDAQGFKEDALELTQGRYFLDLKREDATDAPLPYSILISEGAAPRPNREVEPNDTPEAAMPLPDSLRVSATAMPDDMDVYQFTVPDDKAGHLWRVFTVDASRIQLEDSKTTIADIRASGRRSMVDALALAPGEYLVTVRAEGDYMLRVMDLGPRPSDFEGEPNNVVNEGQRLEFGSGVRGGFTDQNDIDYYLFRLDAASSIEIKIHPAGDGRMDVKLHRGSHQVGNRIAFEPGDAPYTFLSTLPAGDWSLALRALDPAIQENYEISVERVAVASGSEPDDDPLDAIKLPRDGDFASSVGAFDGADQVFIPLPQGEGQAALICINDSEHNAGLWRLYHWSDASKVADVRQGIAIFSYSRELGGAVRFGLNGLDREIPYHCAMRFPPTAAPPSFIPVPLNEAEPSPDGELMISLARGETRRATIDVEGPEPRFALDLPEGEIAFVNCRDGNGATLASGSRVWSIAGATAPTSDLLGDLSPILSETDPKIVLSRAYATRLAGSTLPLDVDCTLYGVDDLPRPADMGPAAEFRVFETTASTAQNGDGEPGKSAGPPPPGLEALIMREAPDKQAEGDLPVTISFSEIPELAAFSEAGQRFSVQVTVTSEAEAVLPVTVSFDITGEGWLIGMDQEMISLAPGTSATVTAEISAPPWLVPSLAPSLVVSADSGDAFNAVLAVLAISPTAVPLQPFTHWEAPYALRGGLNVLHYSLGARLIDWGGEAPDEQMQKTESGLHDGLAPHIRSINLPLEGITFRLAVTADLAGVMVQLRSTTDQESWPAEVEVFRPDGESGWQRIASSALKSIHAPQYIVFDKTVETDRLRFVFPRCNNKCTQVWVQEIQAIAVPGSHPAGLPPINAADLELGGHVVWANHSFTGHWNDGLLIGIPSASNPGWASSDPILQATVAFHQNRAALLQALNWVGDPDDTARIAAAQVEASVVGPNGPWRALGELTAPPLGEDRSTLAFDPPIWARYLRFSFETTPKETRFGPDAIEAIEVPGTSVVGLWEDDQPRAAYEAANDIQPAVPVAPAGGPTRETAVSLPLATPTPSSVVIERNEDWWLLQVPEGRPQGLRLEFESTRPLVVPELANAQGEPVALKPVGGEKVLEAVLVPGEYTLRIYEPPRSVVISWDTSGSVAQYIPRTVAAVRTWGRSLQPGRDALQLLPFGPKGFLLEEWAESPEVLEPVLRDLPEEGSSASEKAMQDASEGLNGRRGARGIVIMTDAETGMNPKLWPKMLEAMPRVVALSVDSNSRENAAVMMDWANVNGGLFQRVIGPLGLADSLDLANALFRAPKAYSMTATLEELVEVEGEASLTISPALGAASAVGAVELILDASGSMLQRMEGRRRIDIAHEALGDLVTNTLPVGTPFAFRAFGLKEDACLSELVISLGPLDREAAAEAIASVPAINLAKTAIADSLRAAASDLADTNPPRVIVLVTDGEETCEGDPEAAIAQLRASGLDARVNIVGFAIDDAALAETFAAWAEVGGGAYFDANGAEALKRSIAEALQPRFEITRTYLDGRTEVVGHATLGEQIAVPAGRLTITPGSGASGSSITLQVQPQASTEVEYAPDIGLTVQEE
jgi:hypothetical protein